MSNFKMDDYVPVNERIEKFLDKYPEGSIQSEIVELTASRVTFKAYAYRAAEDQRPGVGHSSLEIPGSTPFTRGSEIENAETSAWGRAIAALGFEVKRGLASAEEVRNKQPGRGQVNPGPASRGPASRAGGATTAPAPVQYRREELAQLAHEHNLDDDALKVYAVVAGVKQGERANEEQMDAIIDAIRTSIVNEPAVPTADEVGSPAGESIAPGGDPPSAGPPPKPGTDEYRALPNGVDRAAAKAYWEKHPDPEPETLAEQLQVPA